MDLDKIIADLKREGEKIGRAIAALLEELSRTIGSFVPLNSALGAFVDIRCNSRISQRLNLAQSVSYPI